MARALVIEYPDDPSVWNIGDQWLFGDALLVAPIYNPEGEREVYLPVGAWRDWWTGERLSGGRWLHAGADLERLPLYVREGTIVPVGPVMNYVDESPTREITLRIAPFEGSGETTFVVAVNDEREGELPPVGLIGVRDPESGEAGVIDAGSSAVRRAYAEAAAARREQLRQTMQRSAIDLLELSTGQPYEIPIERFFRERARRVAMAGG